MEQGAVTAAYRKQQASAIVQFPTFPAVPHQIFALFGAYSVPSLFPASLIHPFSATGNQVGNINTKGELSPNKLDLQPLLLALTTP